MWLPPGGYRLAPEFGSGLAHQHACMASRVYVSCVAHARSMQKEPTHSDADGVRFWRSHAAVKRCCSSVRQRAAWLHHFAQFCCYELFVSQPCAVAFKGPKRPRLGPLDWPGGPLYSTWVDCCCMHKEPAGTTCIHDADWRQHARECSQFVLVLTWLPSCSCHGRRK